MDADDPIFDDAASEKLAEPHETCRDCGICVTCGWDNRALQESFELGELRSRVELLEKQLLAARTSALEEAARFFCYECSKGNQAYKSLRGDWAHDIALEADRTLREVRCLAGPIWSAFVPATPEGGK